MAPSFRKILAGLLAIASVSILQSATYYVDPARGSMDNPGTSESPWSTLEAVFASGKTFVAGDIINLRDGFHGSPVVTGNLDGGDVTIQPQSGHHPRLRKLTFNHARRWIVSGLDISPRNASPAAWDTAVIVAIKANSSFITVDNCKVYNATEISGWVAADFNRRMGQGIACEGADCVFTNNHIRKTRNSLTIAHSGPRAIVRGNLIEDILEDGIRCLSDHSVYEYNLLRNWYGVNNAHDDGFQSWTGKHDGMPPGSGTLTGIVIRGNTIINSTSPDRPWPGGKDTYRVHGIGFFAGWFEDIVMENNVLILDNGGHGIAVLGARNSRIVNNTVVRNSFGDSTSHPWITITKHKFTGQDGSGNMMNNNISGRVPAADYAITGTSQSNNIITTNYADYFADYAVQDLHLKPASPAIGAGTAAGAPDIDRDRVPRSIPYDVGAFEFGGERPVAAGG